MIKQIQKKISIIKFLYEKGLFAIFLYVLHKLKISNLYNIYYGKNSSPDFNKKKIQLRNKILNISNSRVISGFYKSTYLHQEKVFNQIHLASQLIGCYELQVQKKIIDMKNQYKLRNLVNFGAGNGFHVLGLILNNFFKQGFCFEIDPEQIKLLTININKNELEKKISIHSEASFEKTKLLLTKNELRKTIFLIDIEGAEFSLINKDSIHIIKNSYLIIENHSYRFSKKDTLNFWKVIDENFDYKLINSSARDPWAIKELDDLFEDEKWIAISESRPTMNWIVCVPKK